MDNDRQTRNAVSENASAIPCSIPSLYKTYFHDLSCDDGQPTSGRYDKSGALPRVSLSSLFGTGGRFIDNTR